MKLENYKFILTGKDKLEFPNVTFSSKVRSMDVQITAKLPNPLPYRLKSLLGFKLQHQLNLFNVKENGVCSIGSVLFSELNDDVTVNMTIHLIGNCPLDIEEVEKFLARMVLNTISELGPEFLN